MIITTDGPADISHRPSTYIYKEVTMTQTIFTKKLSALATTLAAVALLTGTSQAATDTVGTSPWGADDEIGRLNLITGESRAAVLSHIKGDQVYDLSVEYFIGMPSWQTAGDPHYHL